MNKRDDILDAWIMVEHLSEGDININDKSVKQLEDWDNEGLYSLFSHEIEKKNFKSYQDGGIVVYFDIFNFEEVVRILRERYHLNPTNEDIRFGNKFSFALCFDKHMNFRSNMTFFTESAYIRWHQEIPSKSSFREYEEEFMMLMSQLFDKTKNNQNAFNEAMKRLLKKYCIDIHKCRMQIVNDLETDAINLHSFFVYDLERAKKMKTENLERYLLGTHGKRINLDSKSDSVNFNPDVFWEILQPENYPIARFPSNTKYSLSFMQQVAVNLAIGYDNEQIRSVNGPPGTGKTTLLKDVFAELIVEQAYDIADLPVKFIKGTAKTAYYDNAAIGEVPTAIAENNIVVASSNNSAVQNIVNEIPLIKGIDANLIEELKAADYFYEIINSKVSTKWTEDENGKKKETLLMKHAPGEDKFWGLFSLEGGKAENMSNILVNIKHIIKYLENDYIPDDEIYTKFKKQYRKLANIRSQMQAYAEDYENYLECQRDLEKRKASYHAEHEHKEAEQRYLMEEYKEMTAEIGSDKRRLEKQLSALVERREMIEKDRESLMLCIHLVKEQKPCLFGRKKHKEQLSELEKQLNACENDSMENRKEEKKVRDNIWALEDKMSEYSHKQQREQRMLHQWISSKKHEISVREGQLVEYKKRLVGENVKILDMSLDYTDLQLSNPWFDEAYRIAQSKLFIMALRVRKQFLYENRKNIKAAIIIWNKQDNYTNQKDIIVAAWNWINMTIPVISSTFASFSRMCRNVGAKKLGHLFIDEAGQALPQASVGAIYRSKHIMVVGDPSQIKPVLTLDSNVLGMLGEHFKVSKKYLSNSTSTQTLVDEISQYGFYKEQDASADSWIGIPLWVHRRCKYPMFTISNKISYSGLMVQGAPGDGKAEWFDICGKADNKYVKEQGRFLVQKIGEMIKKNPKIINKKEKDIIFVITPFVNVAYHLSQELNKIHFTRYGERGKPTNVGTVHTFQGKEAPIVFMVLGADNASSGAARWAVDEPNLMNVAATRAKEEFYVIGDKKLYLNIGSEVAVNTYQIIDRFRQQHP